MPVSVQRLQADLEAVAACTATPGAGASRPTFSNAWADAVAYIRGQLKALGCQITVDAAGNLHARPAEIHWHQPAWLCGSHIDSVPHGGNFDGVVGVLVALEVLRAAHEDSQTVLPLELVIWAEEEGTTFGLGMIGSRLFAGDLTAAALAGFTNSSGQTYLEAGATFGVQPEQLISPLLSRGTVIGLIEVHIEQGPALWKNNMRLGVVTAIAGRRQLRCTLSGVANHAGSTAMGDRFDALAAAAEIITSLERLADEFRQGAVITVGQIRVTPNAINVIPGSVDMSIDFRCGNAEVLTVGSNMIRELVQRVATERGLGFDLQTTETQPPVFMDPAICRQLRENAKRLQIVSDFDAVSGALHDAAILAAHVPTAMLFIPSRDGISHNVKEFSRLDDIATAARVVLETVRDRRLG